MVGVGLSWFVYLWMKKAEEMVDFALWAEKRSVDRISEADRLYRKANVFTEQTRKLLENCKCGEKEKLSEEDEP